MKTCVPAHWGTTGKGAKGKAASITEPMVEHGGGFRGKHPRKTNGGGVGEKKAGGCCRETSPTVGARWGD